MQRGDYWFGQPFWMRQKDGPKNRKRNGKEKGEQKMRTIYRIKGGNNLRNTR